MNDTMMIAMDIMTKTKTQYIQTYLLLEEEEEENDGKDTILQFVKNNTK
ncbi:MAG: hypothetical protein ACI90V_001878 [Bacillariaceae sp.]|jgi:hypothetical protein